MSKPIAPHPRWVQLLRTAIDTSMKENRDSISYALSTVDDSSNNPAGEAPSPRVRFCVHRGFVNERRAGEDPTWSTNESVSASGDALFSSGMLISTDVRSPKSIQILSHPSGSLVELAWWLTPTKQQFRVRARAFILPSPANSSHAAFPAKKLEPEGLTRAFDWEEERLRIFRKMAPELRASFVRPDPGPLGETDPSKFIHKLKSDLEAETEEEKRDVKEALKQLALIVMEPFEVDLCDLSGSPHTRIVWTKGAGGEWTEENYVP